MEDECKVAIASDAEASSGGEELPQPAEKEETKAEPVPVESVPAAPKKKVNPAELGVLTE